MSVFINMLKNIERLAFPLLQQKIQKNKVLLLYGPRRVGKTTLLEQFIKQHPSSHEILFVRGDTRTTQEGLSAQNIEPLRSFIGNHSILIIDEAQLIPNIGANLKIIVDYIPNISVIASGSAAFSLAQQVGEPLTGRKKTICLYPISVKEIIAHTNVPYYLETLDQYLIYGTYPELFRLTSYKEKKEYLDEIIDSYLFRDILALGQVKNEKIVRDLLTLLAFQIGKEVSLSELANALELHKDTVYRYLDVLERSFIIMNIRGFSRNLRKEVTKTSRYYFYDNGIRNALINNFNQLHVRNDVGMLWENYIVMERVKKQMYEEIRSNNYFWRTSDTKKIDWVEEREGKLFGYEIKWGSKKSKVPKEWLSTYSNAEFKTITKDNF